MTLLASSTGSWVALAILAVARGLGVWLGVWGSRKLGYLPEGRSYVSHFRAQTARHRCERRKLLTRGERLFVAVILVLSAALALIVR